MQAIGFKINICVNAWFNIHFVKENWNYVHIISKVITSMVKVTLTKVTFHWFGTFKNYINHECENYLKLFKIKLIDNFKKLI